jgi:hypothetical protein
MLSGTFSTAKEHKVLKYEVRDGKRVICEPAKITVPNNMKIDEVCEMMMLLVA